jgi:iron complex outermembrane receptor protein
MLARWTSNGSDGSQTQVQGYYSRFARRFTKVYDRLEMSDLSVQHNRSEGRHALVVGAGARLNRDVFINGANFFALDPERRSLWILNAFAQDRIDLGGGLALTAGLKLEKTSFSGVEILPSGRFAWNPDSSHLLYVSAARAVREPSRIDRDLTAPGILIRGTFQPEKLTALEAGYRAQPMRNVSVSVSVFYNLYDDLRSTRPTPGTVIPVRLANGIKGDTWGIEAWGNLQVTPWWRLSAGIATLEKDFRLKPGETDLENFISLGNDPDHNLQIATHIDFSPEVALDIHLRRYGSRPNPLLPAYTDADARLGWQVTPDVELYLAGSNILHDRRDESGDADRGQLVRRMISLGARFGI